MQVFCSLSFSYHVQMETTGAMLTTDIQGYRSIHAEDPGIQYPVVASVQIQVSGNRVRTTGSVVGFSSRAAFSEESNAISTSGPSRDPPRDPPRDPGRPRMRVELGLIRLWLFGLGLWCFRSEKNTPKET